MSVHDDIEESAAAAEVESAEAQVAPEVESGTPEEIAEPEPELEPEVESEAEPEPEVEPEPEPAPEDAGSPFDTISAPSPEAPTHADAALAEAAGPGGLSWIPYAIYLGLWVLLAAASVYFLRDASLERPARWFAEYQALVWAGVALAVLGPVLSLAVWLVVRARRSPENRVGLLASAMTRGAVTAFLGALLWLGTLYALELYAAGLRL